MQSEAVVNHYSIYSALYEVYVEISERRSHYLCCDKCKVILISPLGLTNKKTSKIFLWDVCPHPSHI